MVECFNVHLLQIDNKRNIFDLKYGECIYSQKCLRPSLRVNPIIILADPFLFVHNDILFLFYESKGFFTPGVIKMVQTTDLLHWSEPVIVLEELCHLSYPFVFEDDGCIYMIPETGEIGEVRLYKAVDDSLSNFIYVKTLLKQPKERVVNMGYGDSSIYKKDGIYYLMTMLQYEDSINTLELHVSDNLLGPYIEHPCSPITKNMKTGRNAGSWIEYNGKLYRVSQDCTKRYGDNVNVSEIISLNKNNYQEDLILENILPTQIDRYKQGGHQFNPIIYKGHLLIATDAKEYHSMLCWRVVNRLKNILFG